MPRRLAITIAGAVSLGSYEAGVLCEVLDAIRQHNSDAATTPDEKIVIDVLTGASAGGMTAIILAQKLLFSADAFRGPYDNPLYDAWVQRIDLKGLQATQNGEPALHSIFSSDLIDQIAREILLSRYSAVPVPPQQRHAAVGDEIRVGVALTNLNGVAYGYPIKPSGQFTYIEYCDQLTRHVVASSCDNAAFWQPLTQAAVGSGAFPIAFRPPDIARSAQIEPDDYPPQNMLPWPGDPRLFTYSDGGVLQNQPLGMAKDLVDLVDCHEDQDSRYYLFVSPHDKDPQTTDGFHSDNADYFHLLSRLAGVATGQSGFQDWITAKGVNDKIALLDARAAGLAQAIERGEIDVDALGKTATSILSLFFEGGSHLSPGATAPETLAAAQKRIGDQYSDLMKRLATKPGISEAFRDAVLAFETAAGLGARDHMTIYGVTAKDTELAGAGLQAFLGFFDQKFRDHDYDVGRQHARTVLCDPNLAQPGEIGPIRYTGSPIRPIDTRLNGLPLRLVPAADRNAFKAGLRKRLNEALREMWGPVLSLPAIPGADFILDALIDRMISRL